MPDAAPVTTAILPVSVDGGGSRRRLACWSSQY
jgi:hypothetical protein